MEIVSRSQALLLGKKRYYTGKPCARGHYSERYVCSFVCIACGSEDSKAYYRENGAEELSKVSYRKRKDEGKDSGGSDWAKNAQKATRPKAKNNWARWNQKEDRMLRSLLDRGINTQDIALEMGRTQNSIQNRIGRMSGGKP